MRKKILHLIDSSGFYGAESVVITLCKSMAGTCFYPILGCLTPEKGTLPEVGVVAMANGIEVIPIELESKFDWWGLKKIIRANEIDIIHCHGYKPSTLAFLAEKLSGRRILITCHLWTNETVRLKIYAWLESMVMRWVNTVVAVSETISNSIAASNPRQRNIKVIHNGIDLQKWSPLTAAFDRTAYKTKIGLRTDVPILGIFGRLSAQKGHGYLLHALAGIQAPEFQLLCVGGGSLKNELSRLAESLGLGGKVHFLGFRQDVRELLVITDLFVMPSLDEGLPMALLEAMAMEKAVVVTSVGAVPAVVKNGINGILIPPRNTAELKKAVLSLLYSEPVRAQLGKSARQTVVEKFSNRQMSANYLETYQDMCPDVTDHGIWHPYSAHLPSGKRLQGAGDARHRLAKCTGVHEQAGNAADSVPCDRLPGNHPATRQGE